MWIFCICIVCLLELSLQQLQLDKESNSNPYRPLEAKDYAGVPQNELTLEYKIDKMPSRTYDWSFVAAGGRHTCAIKSGIGWADGVDYTDRLFCFGRNEEGQLDPPAELASALWETVYAGWVTTCGRTKKNPESLICWGDKNSPILQNNFSKAPLGKNTVWISVSLSSMHACAVYANQTTAKLGGTLICWGDDKFGRVSQFPVQKQGKIFQTCAAESHSCALDSGGEIVCWGLNTLGRATVPDSLKKVKWKQLTCGGGHTCAIDVNGWPACWGFGQHGQLELHKPIYDKKGAATTLPSQKFYQISAGLVHTCAIVLRPNEKICTVEGTSNSVSMNALCFGDFSYGQVIAGDQNSYGVPDRPSFYAFKQTERCFTLQWKQISAGGYHSCGITLTDANGINQLICWGLEDDGQVFVMYPGAPASLSTVSSALIACAVLLLLL